MLFCSKRTRVGYEGDDRRGVALPCNSWGCDLCHPRRTKQLIALACRGKPNKLLTLTTRRVDDLSPAAAAKIISAGWKELRKRIARTFGREPPEFLAVFEAHQSGWPHLHILMRSDFIPWKWLSEQWERITGSPGVDIRRIANPGEVAAYVAAYVAKRTNKFGTCKRYRTSRKYQLTRYEKHKPVADANIRWEVQPERLDRIAAAWAAARMTIEWRSVYEVRATSPP